MRSTEDLVAIVHLYSGVVNNVPIFGNCYHCYYYDRVGYGDTFGGYCLRGTSPCTDRSK